MARVFVVERGVTLVAVTGAPVSVIVGGTGNATRIRSRAISTVAPADGEVLLWDAGAAEWAPGSALSGGVAFTDITGTLPWTRVSATPTTLAGYGITDAASDAELGVVAGDLVAHLANVANPHAVTKAQVGLGAVENTALSTWAGSANLVTLGTVTAGFFPAANLSGTTLPAAVVTSSLTTIGTLVGGQVPAARVTAGTFGAGDYIFPADLTISSISGATFRISGVAASTRQFIFQTSGVNRWAWRGASSAAEAGADAGSNFQLVAFSDAGVSLGTFFEGIRAAGGAFTVYRPFEVSGASGSTAITPITCTVRSSSSGNAWLTGPANYWGSYRFISDDSTNPPGAATVRGRLSIHMENANGSLTGLAMWVGPTGGPAVAQTWNSDLSVAFAGAISIGNTLTAETPPAANRTVTIVVGGTTIKLHGSV